MLFSDSFFRSVQLAPRWRVRFHCSQGYSLVELAATIVMIAGIAVLSLPTYQDFGPHEEFAGVGPVQQRQELPDSDPETATFDPSISQPVFEEANTDERGREEGLVDPDRAVR